ncbi:hypothetical protein BaRGS_00020843 [Batillaria attramentaria]|uniref:Uncharacterized protein n=1 Tax=Batillaria attramentaria TaxID=370345 RepID=A0ABD0KLJ7_9CAEN
MFSRPSSVFKYVLLSSAFVQHIVCQVPELPPDSLTLVDPREANNFLGRYKIGTFRNAKDDPIMELVSYSQDLDDDGYWKDRCTVETRTSPSVKPGYCM